MINFLNLKLFVFLIKNSLISCPVHVLLFYRQVPPDVNGLSFLNLMALAIGIIKKDYFINGAGALGESSFILHSIQPLEDKVCSRVGLRH